MPRESNLVIALVLTVVLLLCSLTALIYLLVSRPLTASSAADADSASLSNVCMTPECVALGAFVSKSINMSANPCEDFYEFACGNFHHHVYYKFQEEDINLQGVNYVETMTAMRFEVLDRLHEALTVPPVEPDEDPELDTVHRFTRSLYQSCQIWWQETDDGQNTSIAFVDSLLKKLIQEPQALSQAFWLETLLAWIASTGVGGLFKVTISSALINRAAPQPKPPLINTTRVNIVVNVSEAALWTRVHSGALDHLAQITSHLSPALVEALRPNRTVWQLPVTSSELQAATAGLDGEKEVMVKRVKELKLEESSSSSAFRWSVFFDRLLLTSGTAVDEEALVSVTNVKLWQAFLDFVNLQSSVTEARLRNVQSLIIFDWLFRFRVFLPAETSAMLDEAAVSQGGVENEDRLMKFAPFGSGIGRGCMRITQGLLQPIVESLYRRAYMPGDFASVQQLIGWVKTASAEAAQRDGVVWMTRQSRLQVAEKIMAVRQAIGFDELPPIEVKRFHSPCIARFAAEPASEDEDPPDFPSVYFAALCAYQSRVLQALTSNFSATLFARLNPLVVNAYNYFEENRIIFPMALLQPPLYHPSYPPHANLAGLGFIVGHEIGHAFDNYGHTLQKDGSIGHIWDEATEKGYLRRMRCLKDDYGAFHAIPGLRYNSSDTLSNDVADIIGVSAAYGGLKAAAADVGSQKRLPGVVARLTQEQLFFVQLAQSWCVKADPESLAYLYGESDLGVTHSPNRYRVHGMMRHSKHFAATFGCPVGSPMNPKTKCTFW